MSSIAYRPDIDCLRAFAVTSVIAFHYDISPIRSGFVGVDVFFVISGFLITGIIWSEIQSGTFSFAAFYARRARRILPAALAMLCVVLAGSSLMLLPQESMAVAREGLAVVSFSSNFLYWTQQGYFDSAAITKPLLHTWSLAVEEQFYLLYPALAVAAFAVRRSAVLIGLALICAASLALCIIQTDLQPAGAFYLLPARAWQLGLGALLALGAVPDLPRQWHRIVAATIGWLMLAASVNLFSPLTPYPGTRALLPCLGAAIVIWANPTPSKALLTALRPVLAIGLLSYSLYLWHWPVASLAHAVWGPATSGLAKLGLIACCTMLSIASYLLVERPARRADWRPLARTLGATTAGAVAFSVATIWLAGFPSRFSPDEMKLARFLDYDYRAVYEDRSCFLNFTQSAAELQPSCVTPGATPNILLWGDSHAAHLTFGLRSQLASATVLRATMAQCLPYEATGERQQCAGFNRRVLDIIRDAKPDVVVISANWSEQLLDPDVGARLVAAVKSVTATGSKVVVIGPSPQFDHAAPRIAVASLYFGASSSGHMRPFVRRTDAVLQNLIKDLPQTEYVSLATLMCPQPTCPLLAAGVPIAWDEGHLTAEGSDLAATLIAGASRTLRQALSKPTLTEFR